MVATSFFSLLALKQDQKQQPQLQKLYPTHSEMNM